MKILKQEILLHYCCQHDHAAVLSLLNDFYLDLFSSHIIQVYTFSYIYKLAIFILFLLSSIVMLFLHCMLNILRYEKIFCETDESIASQHDPSSDAIFLDVHRESIFPFMQFFFSRKLFPLVSLSLAYCCVNQVRYFWESYCGVFLENYFSLLNNSLNLT